MEKFKKLSACIAVLVLIICFMPITAFAAQTSQDGLKLKIWTDKEAYSANEDINLNIFISNTNDYVMKNVAVNCILPEGLNLKSGSLTRKGTDLAAGESSEYIAAVALKNSEVPNDSSGSDDTIPKNNDNDSSQAPQTEDTSKALLWLCVLLLSVAALFATIKYRKKTVKFFSLILCVCLLTGLLSLSSLSFSADTTTKSFSAEQTITVDGKAYNIKAVVSYSVDISNKVTIDTTPFDCIDVDKSAYLADTKVESLSGTVTGKASSISIQIEAAGFEIANQELTISENWRIDNPPLVVGENKITVTAIVSGVISQKSILLICTTNENEAYADLDLGDDDGDKLLNWLEKAYSTDKDNPDTDNDGLSDYDEIYNTYTNPLKADSDDNNVSDANEDFDYDKLNNLFECKNKTAPNNADTDGDGINDFDEIYTTKTDPIKNDTDGDGAEDGWELKNNFDPLTFNSSFVVKAETTDATDETPVTAGVEIQLSGNQVNTLSVEAVSTDQNPLLSNSIPGYMGNAYNFHVDGTFSSAKLILKYEQKLGIIGDDFQPRIYYFNEELGSFEELPNQTVTEGCVTAEVSHFSTYILLNKIAFDEVWKTEILQPETQTSIDIALVIDESGSMSVDPRPKNDKDGIRFIVAKNIVDKLSATDRAAIVKFSRPSSLVQDFTSDKDMLKTAIDKKYNSGATAIYNAVNIANNAFIAASTDQHVRKVMIVLTDGIDNCSSWSLSAVSKQAEDNGIIIYTVGLGNSLEEDSLKQLANATGGKYYHATTADELVEIYFQIGSETIDFTTDSNNDGIPNYYNDLIMNGDLVLSNGSNEFMGINFNDNADYDGDGLLNGEELKIVKEGNKVYLRMASDPLMKHSDSDAIDDYTETKNGTNPMRYSFNKVNSDLLMSDDHYYYASKVNQFGDSAGFQFAQAANAAIYGVWNPGELFRDQIIKYFSDYSGVDYINQMAYENAKIIAVDNLAKGSSEILDSLGKIKYVAENLATNTDYLPAVQKLANLTKESKEMMSRINSLLPTQDYSNLTKLLDNEYLSILKKIDDLDTTVTGKFQLKINGVSKKYSNFMESTILNSKIEVGTAVSIGFDVLNAGVDIVDTITAFSKINANSSAFERNYDILLKIASSSARQDTIDATQTVINAMGKSYGSYGEELTKAIAADTAEGCVNILLSIASKNPYVAAVLLVRDGIALITGIREDVCQMYEMLSIYDMTQACVQMFDLSVNLENDYYSTYDLDPADAIRYLTHTAQLRIVGEKAYIEYMKYDGVLGWFISNKQVEEDLNKNISNIKKCAEYLNLKLASSL